MTKFIKHRIKESLIPTVTMTVIASIIYLAIILLNDFVPYFTNNGRGIAVPSFNLVYFAFLLPALSVLIPIIQTKYLKNKRSADLYLSLPIKRKNLILTNLIIGYAQIIIIFTITFLLGVLTNAIIINGHSETIRNLVDKTGAIYPKYQYFRLVSFYFISTVIVLIPYIINAFIYLRTNNIIDGIVILGIYAIAPSLVITLIEELFAGLSINAMNYTFYSPLINITNHLSYLFEMKSSNYSVNYWFSAPKMTNFYLPLIIYGLIALVIPYFMVKMEKHRKVENIEGITDSYFGYKVMIPLFTITSIAYFTKNEIGIVIVFLSIINILLYMLYQRKIKIGYKYTAIALASIILGVVIGIL